MSPAITALTDLNPQLIGQRLRDRRQARGLSQTHVAFVAGINLGNYNEIEHGKRQSFQVKTLYRLCQVLGMSADALLGLPQEVSHAGA
jgi:transcriptional regulator with XRE-family HTH domain